MTLRYSNEDGLTAKPIDGVGVLRYPSCDIVIGDKLIPAREVAKEMAGIIKRGTVLTLPGDCDENGCYLWDFRIEGGDPGQVEIRRNDE